MRFTVSTKPLKNALGLCIINANVSKFYSKSLLVQITASAGVLTINHAATSILSQVKLRGMDDGNSASIMVDSLLLKQLVSTLTSSEVEFEFTDNALVIHAGKSSFSLPKLMDTSEAQLPTPESIGQAELESAEEVTKADWKFIKEHQMFAKSDSTVNPVYTYVWVSENGDVLVGDYVNSLFTHSTVSQLGETCLLTDTVISLFNNLPDGAKLVKYNAKYFISVNTDGFEYLSEFTPLYESDEIGNYNANIIMGMMLPDESAVAQVNVSDINTVLNQAALLSSDRDPQITCTFERNQIRFMDARVNCTVQTEGGPPIPYELTFKPAALKSVISNCPEPKINISPTMNEGEVVGITVTSGNLSVVLAGVE